MKYRGIVIADSPRGPCIVLYGPSGRKDYDHDIRNGRVLDGRTVIAHKWLNAPTTSNDAAGDFFDEFVNKKAL